MTTSTAAGLLPAADAGKTPAQLLAERTARLDDAYALREPDRVPLFMPASYFLAEWGGISHQQLVDDDDKRQELLERAALHFQPDAIMGPFNDVRAPLASGDRMTRFPGHGLPENGSFQFVEHEFMTADDYDAFLRDASDWTVRTYLPRAFAKFEGLALLPPLAMGAFGTYNLGNLSVLTHPEVIESLKAIIATAEGQAACDRWLIESSRRMAALGFPDPPLVGALIEAPYDFMSDTLRGMRGVMTDMLRRPDKLLAAQDLVLEFQLEHAIAHARVTGHRFAFIPLHRGSDGFMSIAHFERFYWPQLLSMQLRLIEAGITPVCFYEGIWNKRLHYIANDLPAGKTAGWFQASDIFQVKEVAGKTLCIIGGMSNSLLKAGTEDEVRTLTRNVCERVGAGGGFIMATGIGEMEGCRPELVEAWAQATREFGAR